MPCNDVRDRVQLSYNESNLLEAFSMTKKTCGAPVGNALILNYVGNTTIDDIATSKIHRFIPGLDEARTLDRFLLDKQFSALRSAIRSITGAADETPDDDITADPIFTISSIEMIGNTTHVVGFTDPKIDSAKVPGCGSCAKAG